MSTLKTRVTVLITLLFAYEDVEIILIECSMLSTTFSRIPFLLSDRTKKGVKYSSTNWMI